MKNQSNIKVRIPKALFELFRKEYGVTDSKGVLKEMLKSQLTASKKLKFLIFSLNFN